MRSFLVRTTLAAATLATLAAAPAAAQLRIPPIRVFAGLGKLDQNSLGPVGDHVFGHHHSATLRQLGVEAASPLRGMDLRLGFESSHPMLTLVDVRPVDYTQWTATNVDRTSISRLTLDANLHLPRVLDATPYLLVGAGVKRYDFDQAYFADSGQPAIPRDQTRAGLHLGGGASWNVGRYDLFVEGSYFLSRFQNDPRASTEAAYVQDRSFTAGLRIPLHR